VERIARYPVAGEPVSKYRQAKFSGHHLKSSLNWD
jgi:hypothetical protein